MTFPQSESFPGVFPIANEHLGDVFAEVFPQHYLAAETASYDALGHICKHYEGGLWTGYTSPDREIFFTTPPEGFYRLQVPGNFFQGEASEQATGLIVWLMVLNALAWETQERVYSDRFHALRHYAAEHPEADVIFGAID